ncbi:MAG: hypothetical protein U9N52_05445 [Campylobacterota bacterium]|nr:hypothetical protein [Campylobacterota bacterium]
MKFALPLDLDHHVYRYNPCSASKFAIYTVHGNSKSVTYTLLSIVDNPWVATDGKMVCDPAARLSQCDEISENDINHIAEHYVLLEALNGCDYLLGQNFCDNTIRTMKNAGIKIFTIPPFNSQSDKAIRHFLIGAKIADSVEYIHHAS